MAKKRILLVDDEDGFTKIVKLNLEATGRYEVRVENRGESTVPAAKEFKPDLILLDVVMPDLDGVDVYDLVSCDEELKDIPVVFLTAIVTPNEANLQEGGMIGGHIFLAKPITTEKLIKCIEDNIRQ